MTGFPLESKAKCNFIDYAKLQAEKAEKPEQALIIDRMMERL